MAELNVEDYARELHEEVLVRAGVDDDRPPLREEIFTQSVLERLEEHEAAGNADICSYSMTTGKNSAKVNAWMLSADGATLDLFVSRYFGTGDVEEMTLPETRRHLQLVRRFLLLARDGFHSRIEESSDAFRPGQQIHAKADALTTVRLILLTDGVVRPQTLSAIASEKEEPIPGVDVRKVVWDLEKLSHLHVGERDVIELDFENNYGGSIRPVNIVRTLPIFPPNCWRVSMESTDSGCWSETSERFCKREARLIKDYRRQLKMSRIGSSPTIMGYVVQRQKCEVSLQETGMLGSSGLKTFRLLMAARQPRQSITR